jgi:hypothetical protein
VHSLKSNPGCYQGGVVGKVKNQRYAQSAIEQILRLLEERGADAAQARVDLKALRGDST